MSKHIPVMLHEAINALDIISNGFYIDCTYGRGGHSKEILKKLSDTLRKKHQMEGKIDSLTAQGRLQGVVMTGLPVLLGVLLYFLEKDAMSQLWTTKVGYVVLAVIIIMEFLGYIMIKKITTINV